MNRREALVGLACLGSAAAAEALRPRGQIILKDKRAMKAIVPRAFTGWSSMDGGEIVLPKTPDSLSDKLYSELVTRVYHPAKDASDVMLVVAYGPAQNKDLQLHRPETCYPAIGFSVSERRFLSLPLHGGQSLPVVELTAYSPGRVEDILYWARVAEALPPTASQQRWDVLKTAMRGYVGDGVLVRASAVRTDDQPAFPTLRRFVGAMLDAVEPAERKTLIGTQLGASMMGQGRTA